MMLEFLTNTNLGIYIHWPFCLSKCPYCDFNSHVSETIDHNRWRKALIKELIFLSENLRHKKLKSVFFGGGTPSLMHPETVFSIIETIKSIWPENGPIEISLEANPSSIEYKTFSLFRDAGVNRISVGVQALNDKDLKFLGREHSKMDAIKALETAHKTFDRVSFDLIYARPQQDLKCWLLELEEAIEIASEHISVYQLTIEKGTAFYSQHKRGLFEMPCNELTGEFYENTIEKLTSAGLYNYEISNHAQLGAECQHNMIYWRSEDYLGVGPGAHSRLTNIDGKRYAKRSVAAPAAWLQKVENDGHALIEENILTHFELFSETIIMGLRLKEGIPIKKIHSLTSKTTEQLIDNTAFRELITEGYVELDSYSLRATDSGRQRLNGVINAIMDSIGLSNYA
jgi:putative oxygen-independent coproporphyrinogen III oxidase